MRVGSADGSSSAVCPLGSVEKRLKAKYGGSSIGRVAVSKTVGWGFESLPPCQLCSD